MPTLAMQCKDDKNPFQSFIKLLEKKIIEAKDMLLERFEYMCTQDPRSAAFMWENNTMAGYVPEEGIRSALKHGTLVIGQLGLAETLQILLGCDHTTDEGVRAAKVIEALFAHKCAEFKDYYKLNFGVYYTPAENLCYTAMKAFKAKYGVIPNVSDRAYFTNSMHVPVWHNIDPFKKIDIESQLTGYSSAGCITYVELPASTLNNLEALETIVNYAMDKDIPYFAVNVPVDNCQDCGYSGEMNDVCPKCGSTNILKLRRVTGYLSSDYRNFNLGKQDEVDDRTKHING
jgi:ribonucleoside-triphosphate reductase